MGDRQWKKGDQGPLNVRTVTMEKKTTRFVSSQRRVKSGHGKAKRGVRRVFKMETSLHLKPGEVEGGKKNAVEEEPKVGEPPDTGCGNGKEQGGG